MTIKGLTISEPWASKIAAREKFLENRSWFTGYRGWLGIHAGRGTQYLTREELAKYPAGCFVAVGRLVACLALDVIRSNAKSLSMRDVKAPGTRYTWAELAAHKYADGPFCLVLEDVFRLPHPVQCKGAQGLWVIPEDVVADMRAQHEAGKVGH